MTRRRPLTRTSLSAAARRDAEREKALAACQRGHHDTTPTFRPGEKLYLICSVVFYCPTCLHENSLVVPQVEHAYPLDCAQHQKVEAQPT